LSSVLLIAHGLVVRSDLPIPEWLFGWAAAMVLVISFVGLAVLWPEPRLQEEGWRPLPDWFGRVITSTPVDIVCGAFGVFLLGLTVYSGFQGTQSSTANFAPTLVYVIFWIGLVPTSVILGDLFRAFNPWRAIGRAVSWVARTAARGPIPAPLEYPAWLGRWPAAAGILAFATMELVVSEGSKPENLAIAALVYSALTFVAMALYGVDAWIDRGEAYSVYFNLFSRISIFERRGRQIGVRKLLSGLASMEPLPGTVALVAVMIGSVTFDGAAEAPLWTNIAPHLSDFFHNIGVAQEHALEAAFFVGLMASILIIYGFYWLGVVGAASVGGGFSKRQLGYTFIHTLVPIALAYVMAHYLTLLLFQGQSLIYLGPYPKLGVLASDPLGTGSNIFGTAEHAINFNVITSNETWYCQVAFVVLGHVAGLTLAHDRALAIYDKARLAVRSQYWMLGVMIGFTSLALWLLSQANT
jgi:hypothetical protein